MAKAEELVSRKSLPPPEVTYLGWITRLVGMVGDRESRELIVVGYQDPAYPRIMLDDIAVALRVVYLHSDVDYPGLSIDPDTLNPDSWQQNVRYVGGIENSRFGSICFETDTLLKSMDMGTIPSGSPDVISPMHLEKMTTPVDDDSLISKRTRTFFYPISFQSLVLGNAAYLQTRRIVVLSAGAGQNPAHDHFTEQLTRHYDEVACTYPVLEELRNMMSAYALAKSMPDFALAPDVDYWLNDYKPLRVPTPFQVDLWVRGNRGLGVSYIASGQIELRSEARMLNTGDPLALERIVFASRPPGRPLVWSFTLEDESVLFAGTDSESKTEELIHQGRFLLATSDYKRALTSFKAAVALGADANRLRYDMALSKYGLGKPDQALAECERAIQADPSDHKARILRGGLLADQDRGVDARTSLRTALEENPDSLSVMLSGAKLYLKLGDLETAKELVDHVLDDHQGHQEALLIRGKIRQQLSEKDEALEDYRRAIQSGGKPHVIREAYYRGRRLVLGQPWYDYSDLPQAFLDRKSHVWDLSLGLYPSLAFGQALAPEEYKQGSYHFYGEFPVSLSLGAVFWNKLRLRADSRMDFEIRRLRSKKWEVDESGAKNLVNLADVFGFYSRLGHTLVGFDWLALDGFRHSPYLVLSSSAYCFPVPEPLFRSYPTRKAEYDVSDDDIVNKTRDWKYTTSIRTEVPLMKRWWVCSGVSYQRGFRKGEEDYGSIDLKFRAILSLWQESIFGDLGSTWTRSRVLTGEGGAGQQFHIYVSVERSRKRKSEVLMLGIFLQDDVQSGKQVRYYVGSIQFNRELLSFKRWF
ncbi:MAG: tetratricopeptide repeat protein [Candidatus Eisenbacteria bacterium]